MMLCITGLLLPKTARDSKGVIMKKNSRHTLKTKHLITMMTILCIGLIVLSLSSRFSFAPVRNTLGYVVVPFQNGINQVGTWLNDQKNGFQIIGEEF